MTAVAHASAVMAARHKVPYLGYIVVAANTPA
jgi:hypothetical protein